MKPSNAAIEVLHLARISKERELHGILKGDRAQELRNEIAQLSSAIRKLEKKE